MAGVPLLLLDADDPLCGRVRADVCSRFPQVQAMSWEENRNSNSWRQAGPVLVLTCGTNAELLARVVREFRLRRSAKSIVVIEAGEEGGGAEFAALEPFITQRIRWPEGAKTVANLVVNAHAEKRESLADLLGRQLESLTPSLASLAGRMAVAAMHDVTVLLTGETGTGKTFFAKLLHDHSPRRDQPFLVVPCGAQPPELFASTFFGHVKGAFTGAHQNQRGKFACAGSGTILLDEIDTLELEQQAALLRVIETGEFEMVGDHQTFQSQARIIVTSNSSLEHAVDRGRFRQDLFYRLNVMAFHLPPLRERPADIPLLARGFAAQYAAKYNKAIFDISDEALQLLAAFPWPGNVRQLENAIQEAVLLCEGTEICERDLPSDMRRDEADRPIMAVPALAGASHAGIGLSNGQGALLRNRAEYERNLIQQTLTACRNNRSAAARLLGVSRVTLHKKINQYRLRDVPS